ncbi:MAG: TRAP transporter large permease subunit, partial [Tistlia sp.]
MEHGGLDLLMFAVACVVLLLGFPVAFSLAGVALAFGALGWLFGDFDPSFFSAMPQRIFGTMTNEVLIAVPLFVFMGVMLERSKVAEELLENMGRLFGTLRGGLGISVSIVGMLLAASTGIVGATVVTMGLLSLPTMLRHGYDPKLACGAICAAGTLGQIIPPSIVLVLLGDVISNSFQQAQLSMGNFSPRTVSVGDLFAGALLPGVMLVGLYILYQLLIAYIRPESSPALPPDVTREGKSSTQILAQVLHALLPPVVLIVAVLGSILAGIASPTEAAGVGAVGSIMLAGLRLDERHGWSIYAAGLCLVGVLVLTAFVDLRVTREMIPTGDMIAILIAALLCLGVTYGVLISLWRVWRVGVLKAVVVGTANVSAMVFVILIGAALFSLVFRGLGGEELVHDFLTNVPGGAWGAIAVVMVVMFFLGFFLDFIEITFVVVPLIAPALFRLGVDPVWLGVLIA